MKNLKNETTFELLNVVVSSLDKSGVSSIILNSTKSIFNIRDRIYLSKFQKFWRAPEENKLNIKNFIEKTKGQEDWQKVGENFLLVIDSFSDFDKCYYYGKIWVAWLEKKINTEEILEMTNIIQGISSNILQKILYDNYTRWNEYCQNRIYSCGIADSKVMDFSYDLNDESIKLRRPCYLSDIGKKLKQILK